jgi:two-component system, OmpR family, sensor histidine kinase ChvG
MASDTVTGTVEARNEQVRETIAPAADRTEPAVRSRPRLSRLTRRIVAVNILALGVLGVGLLQLGGYQQNLVDADLAALKTQAQVFAAAIGEGAVAEPIGDNEALLPDLARQMIRRLVAPTHARVRLFDVDGQILADTGALRSPGGIQIIDLPPPEAGRLLPRIVNRIYALVARFVPSGYPLESSLPLESPGNFPEVKRALSGDSGEVARRNGDGGLVLSAAVPVQHYRQVLGALLLSSDNGGIEERVREVRLRILETFAIALGITVLLSIYLAGAIGRPIRRLAQAAELVRRGHGRQVAIPDLTERGDEIGDLSGALRDMTEALWQRADAIERFAADVAHEIKNPLSSVRSAMETAARVDDREKRQKLLSLVLDDIERLTRLITDISEASRLDAELNRRALERVYVGRILQAIVDVEQPGEALGEGGDKPRVVLTLPAPAGTAAGDLAVLGHEDRLVQVFRNIIANAISFSPPHGTIPISATRQAGTVTVTIDDEGPGLPGGKLEAIFERFYSERPPGEKFGIHSGLGLSISKQIIESHRGTIRAQNRFDGAGAILGARFIVRLPAR